MHSASILDQLASSDTRPRLLEVCFIAHTVQNPQMVPRSTTLKLTHAAIAVLDVIRATPSGAAVALEASVALALQWESPQLQLDAIGLAHDAAHLSVQDLASVGSLRHVMELIASERLNATASPRAKAA